MIIEIILCLTNKCFIMKAQLLLIFGLVLSLSCYSQSQDYFITLNNDTIHGVVISQSYSGKKGNVFKFLKTDGGKCKVDVSKSREVCCDGFKYVVKKTNPDKPKEGMMDFVKIIVENDISTVYGHQYAYVSCGGGYTYAKQGVSYYLFDNDAFVDFLDAENYKELMPGYFENSESLTKVIKYDQQFDFEHVSDLLDHQCK